VIDHRVGKTVVQTLDYPGRPHGVAFVPAHEDDEDNDD
jgi:hypothetical protein